MLITKNEEFSQFRLRSIKSWDTCIDEARVKSEGGAKLAQSVREVAEGRWSAGVVALLADDVDAGIDALEDALVLAQDWGHGGAEGEAIAWLRQQAGPLAMAL